MKYAPSFKLKIEACIHYVAESLLAKDYYFIGHSTNRLFTLISVVPGVVIIFYNKKENKEENCNYYSIFWEIAGVYTIVFGFMQT